MAGVAAVTRSVDLEETAEASTVVRVGLVETVAGKVPESAMLKRAAAGKTKKDSSGLHFICNVWCFD